MKDRIILHCDMNNFFASVELLDHPELKGVPVAVCGDPKNRHGIVLAKSYAAKEFGVMTAEPIWKAKQKCPGLVTLPPHHHKYTEYYHKINDIYLRYTDMVEPFSVDESWLDVTASTKLFGSGKEIADAIRNTVKKELGLTLSAGVSYNKIFAKMGSEYKKPDATTEITRENYKEILWPQPAGDMFFVGRKSAAKLKSIGITTIGGIATADPALLTRLFGKMGEEMWRNVNGLDDSPVARFDEITTEKSKSISHGVTFKHDLTEENEVETAVVALADKVAARLRSEHQKAYGVKVDIAEPTLNRRGHQMALKACTSSATDIAKAAMHIIKSYFQNIPYRAITITAYDLTDENDAEQMSLFEYENIAREQDRQLSSAMDEIRDKFGKSSISFAAAIDQDDIGIGK